jgi:uncharacterized membrane protein YbhN (UPF0104 family)
VATVALVVLVLHRAGGGLGFLEAARVARGDWVLAAFLASAVCVLLGVERWRLVLGAMGHSLGFWRGLVVVLAVWPLALVTPSRANELLRALAIRDVVPLPAGTGSVLAEKAVDLFVLLVLAALGVAARGMWLWAGSIGALAALEAAAVVLVATRRPWLATLPPLRGSQRASQRLDELFAAYEGLRRAPGRLAAVTAVSVIIRVLTVGVTHALLLSVGAKVALIDTLTFWPAATLVGVAPLTLAGIGTRDAAFIHLLTAHGSYADEAQVLAATMGYTAVAIVAFAVIGLPFMIREALGRSASAAQPARSSTESGSDARARTSAGR